MELRRERRRAGSPGVARSCCAAAPWAGRARPRSRRCSRAALGELRRAQALAAAARPTLGGRRAGPRARLRSELAARPRAGRELARRLRRAAGARWSWRSAATTCSPPACPQGPAVGRGPAGGAADASSTGRSRAARQELAAALAPPSRRGSGKRSAYLPGDGVARERRHPLARGRAAGRAGRLLDPARRRQRRRPSRASTSGSSPATTRGACSRTAAGSRRARPRAGAGRDRPPGPRRRDRRRTQAPQQPEPVRAPGSPIPEVDGHVIAGPGLAPLVFVADCLPIALAGPGGVAMLHCGWRGLAGRDRRAAARPRSRPSAAAIGPGIGPCCYEVGDEVLEAFAPLGRRDRRRPHARPARRSRGGCSSGPGWRRSRSAELCTSCEPELFFSHRRDGGRHRPPGGRRLARSRGG